MLEQRFTPVFILGAGHSGTTISYRMLALHPETMWFSQFSQRDGLIPGRRRLPAHNYVDAVLRKLVTHDWRKKHSRVRQSLIPTPKEGHQIWEHMLPKDATISTHESARRMRELLEMERAFWKRSYFLAKQPRFHRFIPTILEAYPQTRFVLMVRDGRAVALAHRHKPRKAASGLSETEILVKACKVWAQILEKAERTIPREQLFELRYEDLCLDVHGRLRAALAFLGLDQDLFPFERCPRSLPTANARRFADVTKEQRDVLSSILAEDLRRHGYDPDSWGA